MRVLVTGATGFLGGEVSRYLTAKGHHVVALGRDRKKLDKLESLGIQCVQLDLTMVDATSINRTEPMDAVVHCAALSSPWGPNAAFQKANVGGTQTALKLALKMGVKRFVNISSPTLYFAMSDQENIKETERLPRPINAYAATKAVAERLVMACTEVGPVSLRPRGIYGAGDTTLLPRFLAAAKRGSLPLLRDGVAAIDLTHVSDVVAAIEACLIAGADVEGEIFNISGGEQIAVRDIVESVAAYANISVAWRAMPMGLILGVAQVMDVISRIAPNGREPRITPYALGLFAYRQSLDITKAQRMLNWSPQVPLSKGLGLTFAGDVN